MDPTRWLPIIDGSRRDLVARLWRMGLTALTPAYRLAIAVRNRHFDRGRGVSQMPIPVLSVGNLTTGGTGKTPFVIWLARRLRASEWAPPHGLRVAIISRGYGAAPGEVNDEALEMELQLPDVPHLQSPDRVAIARTAIEQLESQVLVMDDGFQHRKLARDLDIVLIDATNPFGYRQLLPRGLLREPISALKRADVIVLTRTESVAADKCRDIEAEIRAVAPDAVWVEATTHVVGLCPYGGEPTAWNASDARPTFGFAAIGNPQAFHQTLKRSGFLLTGFRAFPDHHRWSRDDLGALAAEAKSRGAEMLVCTQKDLVKIQTARLADLPLAALQIELNITRGSESLIAAIRNVLEEHRSHLNAT